MNARLKLIFLSCALFFMSWTSSALGQGLSNNYNVQGHYYGDITPIVTTVGNTTFNKITFEGIGNNLVIGTIGGATFSNRCLGVIDSDVGASNSGNFANEPSPSTIAYFLADNQCTVTFAEPVSGVSIFYTSTVSVTLRALNGATEIASAVGTANSPGGTGDPNGAFATWTSLDVNAGTNLITSVQILGANNQTGFDDFTFATTAFLEPFEPVSSEVVSQAGNCNVTRILGERDRTDEILTQEGSGCETTGPLGLTLDGQPVTGLFVSPNAQITTVLNPTLFCWPSTTTGKVTCVKGPEKEKGNKKMTPFSVLAGNKQLSTIYD